MDRCRLGKVYFSDETQIILVDTSGSGYVWRRPGEELNEENVTGTRARILFLPAWRFAIGGRRGTDLSRFSHRISIF